MNKNFSYPQKAQDQKIQGTVLVQFMIDTKGSASDIKAISGPELLREVCVNLIKNVRKWIPASTNGQIVNSYRKHPFTFRLETESFLSPGGKAKPRSAE
jgi:TonB family protein